MEVWPNSGFLMKNHKKEQDSHTDMTGTWSDADGQEFYLSAWSNTSQKTGNKYLKLKLGKQKSDRATPVKEKKSKPVAQDDLDSDIPF